MNIHEYQAKAILREFGVAGSARRSRLLAAAAAEAAAASSPAPSMS